MFVLVREVIADEYVARAEVVHRRWRDVIAGQNLAFAPAVAELIRLAALLGFHF